MSTEPTLHCFTSKFREHRVDAQDGRHALLSPIGLAAAVASSSASPALAASDVPAAFDALYLTAGLGIIAFAGAQARLRVWVLR